MHSATAIGGSLVWLVLLACLHGAAHALVRPLFQVSDELSYLSGAQLGAQQYWLADDSPLRTRVAPPDGSVLYWPPAGKPAFQIVAGGLLTAAATIAEPPAAAMLARAVLSLSLPIAVLFTLLLAREVFPHDGAVLVVAPALVAFHPVFASFAASVSPDAPANALAAASLWLLARFALRRSHPWEPVALLITSAATLAFKDTGFFLGPAILAGTVVRAFRARRQQPATRWPALVWRDPWLAVVPALLFLPALVPSLWRLALRSPYLSGATLQPSLPLDALRDTMRGLPGLLHTFWSSLGNFGARDLSPPAAVVAVAIAVSAVGAASLARNLVAPPRWQSSDGARAALDVFGVFAIGGLVLLLQPAVRQILTAQVDAFQGRWMFPMLPVIAVYGCAGLSSLTARPAAIVPLAALLLTSLAVLTLACVVVPNYYASFPSEYLEGQLYLQGPYGAAVEQARVRAFVAADCAPGWLTATVLVGFAVTTMAWAAWVARLAAASARDTIQVRVHHHPD